MPVVRSTAADSITVPSRLYSWSRWTVECSCGFGGKSGAGNCLNTWLLVKGEDGDRTFRFGQRAQHLGRSVDFEDLGFTLVELRIAALQLVAHFVRLDCLTVQNAGDRARRELG